MSSSRHHHKRRTRDSSSPDSSNKEKYREVKHELKKRTRDLDQLEDQLDREAREAKKAKQDTQDLWKVYYTLQTEVQQAYERNAKLQADKATLESLFDSERKDWQRQQSESKGENAQKLKEALCAMQKEKMELQQKFNDIVLENKKLKDKESTYEPRLREMEKLKQKLVEAKSETDAITQSLSGFDVQLKDVIANKEEVCKYRRWNSLLSMESEQKLEKLQKAEMVELRCKGLSAENELLKKELAKHAKEKELWSQPAHRLRQRLTQLLICVRQLKLDWSWSGDSVKADLARAMQSLNQSLTQIQEHKQQLDLRAAIQAHIAADQFLSPESEVPESLGAGAESSPDDSAVDTISITALVHTLSEEIGQGGGQSSDELREKISSIRAQLDLWEHKLHRRIRSQGDMVELMQGSASVAENVPTASTD